MHALEQRVLDAIDIDGLVTTASNLIGIRSDGGDECHAQREMAKAMANMGLQVDHWAIDFASLRKHPAYTVEIERESGQGLVGWIGEGRDPTLIMNGHIDVVPAGERPRWTVPPFIGTVRDGRLYGRGACDMKGGLTCALFAAKAIIDSGVRLRGKLMIHSVIGEEDGGAGTLATIERGHTGDAAIIMEPTQLVIAPAQAGAFNFRIEVPGSAAHGALRAEGVDPVEKFIPLFAAMRKFEAARNDADADPLFADYEIPYALCIGTLRAGIWASTVAETLTCEGRLGIATYEDSVKVRGDFERCIADAARQDSWLCENRPRVIWWGAQFEAAAIDPDHPLVGTVGEALRDATGREPLIRGMPYGADMRLLVREAQIPTVIFGPGDIRQAHAPDEYVEIAELEAATRALALAALRFCGVGD